MNLYTHLTISEREQIFLLHHQGDSIRMIAKALKRSPSTISRELASNIENQNYSPTVVQSNLFLYEQWSPKQIAARLILEKSYTISFNTIYRAIYGGVLMKPI